MIFGILYLLTADFKKLETPESTFDKNFIRFLFLKFFLKFLIELIVLAMNQEKKSSFMSTKSMMLSRRNYLNIFSKFFASIIWSIKGYMRVFTKIKNQQLNKIIKEFTFYYIFYFKYRKNKLSNIFNSSFYIFQFNPH